jgi:hypothetical protein
MRRNRGEVRRLRTTFFLDLPAVCFLLPAVACSGREDCGAAVVTSDSPPHIHAMRILRISCRNFKTTLLFRPF